MPNAVEIEAKALLSEEEHRKLFSYFSSFPVRTQTNHFFDTPDLSLSANLVALRVREMEGTYEFTMKTNLEEGRLERNLLISKEQFEDLKAKRSFPEGDAKDYLLSIGLDLSRIGLITSLTTMRKEGEFEGGVLSIDRNSYSDITDYEIEYESTSMEKAEKTVRSLLEKLAIPVRFSQIPKIRRALDAYKKPMH